MNNSEMYFKKIISYYYRGKILKFRVSNALFSSFDVDLGTKHLLQTFVVEGASNYNKILDFGCGYGPIGISLKSKYPASIVHMVDRDALALDFSKQNIKLNGDGEFKIYGSLGFDDIIETDFDLIVSNIPAKVGEQVLTHILEDSRFYLRPGGRIAIVVIDAIGEYVTKVLKSNKDINILFYKRWPGYLVFHYEFVNNRPEKLIEKMNSFQRNIYDRGKKNINIGSMEISIKTVYGLSEFDILSYETELLLNKMKIFKNQKINRAVVFNVGQGFISTTLSSIAEVKRIDLIDRDLLALRVSKRNMVLNGYNLNKVFLFHQVGIENDNSQLADCVIGILDDKDDLKVNSMIIKGAKDQLSESGIIMIASSSTIITRLESLIRKDKTLKIIERQKSKRKSMMIIKKKN